MKTAMCTKYIAVTLALTVAALSLPQSTSQAGHCRYPEMRTDVTWVVQQHPDAVYHTRYIHCGRAYRVKQDIHHTFWV
jgi:hypothetical protein